MFYYERPDGKAWDNDNLPSIAVISKGNDLTYIQLTRNLLNREIFDTSGRDWLKSGYDAVIFSPRDIYRTGENAPFKLIVRNADITTPEAFPVIFSVKDTLGRKVRQEAITLNAKGSAIANLQLPGNALTGTWTAYVAVPGNEDKPIASYKFHVEDFAPPRIEVKLNTYRQYLLHGDTFTADIYARWLFGVDGAGLNYKSSWTAKEGTFTPTQDRWKGYSFGDPSRKFAGTEGELGEEKLDNFGAAKVNLKLDENWEAPTIINLTLRTEVMEDSGRWTTATLTRPYYSAPWLLGIAPLAENFSVNSDIAFRVNCCNFGIRGSIDNGACINAVNLERYFLGFKISYIKNSGFINVGVKTAFAAFSSFTAFAAFSTFTAVVSADDCNGLGVKKFIAFFASLNISACSGIFANPFTGSMGKLRSFIIHIVYTAFGAGVNAVTGFRAGRFKYICDFKIMSLCRFLVFDY